MKVSWIWCAVLSCVGLATAGTLYGVHQSKRRAALEICQARAQIAASNGRWQAAEVELNALLTMDPESDGGWLMLGDVQFRQGRVTEAIQSVARVPSGSSNGAAARQLEGTLLLIAGRGSESERVLKECLYLDPRSIEARRRLVFLYGIELRRNDLQRILWELHALGAAETSDLVLLSGSSFIVWNAAEIVGTVQKFVAADPNDIAARVAVGRYLRRQSDLDEARRILEQACRLGPRDPDPLAALIECLIDRNEMNDADRVLERLPADWDQDPRFAFFRGRVHEQFDRTDEAIQFYHRAAQLDPDHREANYRLGQLLLQSGDGSEAARHLERARMLSEREVLLGTLMDTRERAHYAPVVARLEVELGHERLARAWFEEAVRLNPYDEALRSEAAGFARRVASASGSAGPDQD